MKNTTNEDSSSSTEGTDRKYVHLLSYVGAIFMVSNVALLLLFTLTGDLWSYPHQILAILSVGWSFSVGYWYCLKPPFSEEDADPVQGAASHVLNLVRVAPEPHSKLREKVQYLLRHRTLDEKQIEAVLQIVVTERPDLSEDVAAIKRDLLETRPENNG